MTRRNVLCVSLAITFASHLYGQDQESAVKPQPAFQQVSVDVAADLNAEHALVMGTYVLNAEATDRLLEVDTLKKAVNHIRLTDWKVEPWTKQNAELTIRQRMNDYIQTAQEFYSGNGKRAGGVVGNRLAKYTDTELGDRQLAAALKSVRLASAWDVPLETGQAERLDTVIRVRLAMIPEVTTVSE